MILYPVPSSLRSFAYGQRPALNGPPSDPGLPEALPGQEMCLQGMVGPHATLGMDHAASPDLVALFMRARRGHA